MTQCPKSIMAGPGHQSRHPCVWDATLPHHHHRSEDIGFYYEWSDCHEVEVVWSDEPVAFTTFFNQEPGHCDDHNVDGEEWSP